MNGIALGKTVSTIITEFNPAQPIKIRPIKNYFQLNTLYMLLTLSITFIISEQVFNYIDQFKLQSFTEMISNKFAQLWDQNYSKGGVSERCLLLGLD